MIVADLLRRHAGAAALALLLAGCAGWPYAPTAIRPGDSRADVLRAMGPPSAVHAMPDGHERLEYNHMPAGRQTFMVDLDAGGRVAQWANVLDEEHFAAVHPGMSADDVRRLIGPPSFTGRYMRPEPGITWLYRFQTIQRCIVFEVAYDRQTGRVVSAEYPPDPGCADEWR